MIQIKMLKKSKMSERVKLNINKEEARLLMLGESWVLPVNEYGDAIT